MPDELHDDLLETFSLRGIAGVVGVGLMGTSIAACLLAAGHTVVAVEADHERRTTANIRLLKLLQGAASEGLTDAPPSALLERFSVSGDYQTLQNASLVVESTIESAAVKRTVIAEIERSVSPDILIGSNTSAIPVTELQQGAQHPERIVGLHWAEPAHITRFMEVVQGEQTSSESAQKAMEFAMSWGKEPSLVRGDVRGFITNRIFYAMLREAFHLVESGVASVEDVDRSLRNDLGYWITFAGPFRFMDLTGIPAYKTVMEELLPDLDRSTETPALMRQVVASGAKGVSNARGFYSYDAVQAKQWEEGFLEFSYEIRRLAEKYSTKRIAESKG